MIQLNCLVRCQPNGNLLRPFVGKVEKIYERTAMVTVTEYHRDDHWKVVELTGRVIVALNRMQPQIAFAPALVPVNSEVVAR